jgi:hypothetical protein
LLPRWKVELTLFVLAWVSRYFPPAVAKVYIESFRTHDDRRPSEFIVLADNMKSAIKMAWEHGGPDFQSILTVALGPDRSSVDNANVRLFRE